MSCFQGTMQNFFRRSKRPETTALQAAGGTGLLDVNQPPQHQTGEPLCMTQRPTFADGADSPTRSASSALDGLSKTDSYGVKVLFDPPSPAIDVVFIHGLTGSAYSTWLHRDSGTHWPRDLLKSDLSHARIMTFGYDADIARFWGQAAQDGISGYANDLLGKLARKRVSSVSGSRGLQVSSLCSRAPVFSPSDYRGVNRKVATSSLLCTAWADCSRSEP